MKSGFIDILLVLILIIAIGMGVYAILELWPSATMQFKEINQNLSLTRDSIVLNSTQFYSNMRYPDRRISYTISSQCDSKKRNDMINAFTFLSQETVLTFYETNNGEIIILCSDIAPAPEDKGHFIAGEGGPKEIIETGAYHVIFSGKIALYKDEKCNEPKIALHELLHALGFDHNSNPKSVLYPITSCDEQLDDYVINEINKLYSVDSLPDLAITDAKAEKTGRYLSLTVEISNEGLKDSSKFLLQIYADGKNIKELEVEGIQVGFRKIISVDNLRISSNTQEIDFAVNQIEDSKEITNKNNEVELKLLPA